MAPTSTPSPTTANPPSLSPPSATIPPSPTSFAAVVRRPTKFSVRNDVEIHTQLKFALGLYAGLACLVGAAAFSASPQGGAAMSLELKSPDFAAGGTIPEKFTCKGTDI